MNEKRAKQLRRAVSAQCERSGVPGPTRYDESDITRRHKVQEIVIDHQGNTVKLPYQTVTCVLGTCARGVYQRSKRRLKRLGL